MNLETQLAFVEETRMNHHVLNKTSPKRYKWEVKETSAHLLSGNVTWVPRCSHQKEWLEGGCNQESYNWLIPCLKKEFSNPRADLQNKREDREQNVISVYCTIQWRYQWGHPSHLPGSCVFIAEMVVSVHTSLATPTPTGQSNKISLS